MANLMIILPFLSLIPFACSLRFDLQSGSTKCMTEDIQSNTTSIVQYSVVNLNLSHPLSVARHISVRVTSPHGSSLHNADNVAFGNFSFVAPVTGDYMACFWMKEKEPIESGSVDLGWKTRVAPKDWDVSDIMNTGQVYEMEVELRKLQDTVKLIHDEMFYLRERDLKMQDMNISTTSRMVWLSFISLAVCLSVAGIQLYHLKTYFVRKKVL